MCTIIMNSGLKKPSAASCRGIALCICMGAVLVLFSACNAATVDPDSIQLQRVTINFPTRSGASWPMFLAKEGGYYEKYGLDANLVFGAGTAGVAMISSGEAHMTNSSLEQALQASSRDGSLVAVGASLNRGFFALMASPGIASVQELRGKSLAVSQIGDAPYNYSVALLAKFGLTSRDVQWIPVGTDATGRASALATGRVDATLLTAPAYFRLEEAGFKSLAHMEDYDDVYASTVYLFRKSTIAANPEIPELLIKAHAEAIKRFYDDKPFAVESYMAFDRQEVADVERIYDRFANAEALERIPYVTAAAIQSVLEQADTSVSPQMRTFDFRTVVDNSYVDKLVAEGFFESLYGPEIKAEQERKAALSYR